VAVNVPINFFANVDDAAKEFGKLSTVLKAVGAAFVANKILDGISSITSAAAEAEASSSRMANALKLSGDFSEQNVKAFEALAVQIQRTTSFDDDLILSQVAVAKQFGATNAEAEKLILAATDLSAATGQDLSSAVQLLGKSLDGTAGRLGETIPEVQKLTAEQLAAGGAIDLVANRFRGAAENELLTFNGVIKQLSNNAGNLVESFGDVIVKNDAVKVAIKGITTVFQTLQKIFEENRNEIRNFVATGVVFAVNAFGVFVEAIRIVDKTITSLIVGVKTLGFGLSGIGRFISQIAEGDLAGAFSVDTKAADDFNKSIESSVSGLEAREVAYDKISTVVADVAFETEKAAEKQASLTEEVKKTAVGFDKLAPSVARVNKEVLSQFTALESQLKNIGATERDTLVNQLNAGLETVRKALKEGGVDRERASELNIKLALRFNKDVAVINKKEFEERQKLREEEQKEIEDHFKRNQERLKTFVSDPVSGAFSGTNLLGLTEAVQESVARGLGGVGLILQGGSGAKKLLGGLAEQMGTAFLGVPGFGALFEQLAAGPEQVRAMVAEFAKAIPDIIVAVLESLPVLIETLAENLDEIVVRLVDKLAERAPDIALAIAKAVTITLPLAIVKGALGFVAKVIEAGANFLAKVVDGGTQFIGRIVEGAGQFISKILEGAVQFTGKILEGAVQFVQKIIDSISGSVGLGGGGGGLGGLIGTIGGGVGLGGSVGGVIGGLIGGAVGGGISLPSLPSFGFAEGGLVPDGFPNDSFPAKLTSGEQVFDNKTTERMNRFLDSQERGTDKNLTVNIKVGEEDLARVMLNLNRRGFRTA